jgi:hypothetical protein
MNINMETWSLTDGAIWSGIVPIIIIILALWTIPWKGAALWKAARQNQLAWFVVLLLLNTIGILEILYIFIFSKTKVKK